MAWGGITLALVLVVLALIYRFFTATFSYWRDRGVPFVKGIPVFGSMTSVFLVKEHIMEFNRRLYHNFEGHQYLGYFQGRRPALMVLDPELAKNIFIKDFPHFVDHGFKINEKHDPLEAKNLFNMEGQKWKAMRAKLTPTFTSGRMKAMFPLVKSCSDQFETHLRALAISGEPFEAKEMLSRYTTDVIGSCAFGIECNSLEDPDCEFRRMGKRLVELDFFRAIKIFVMFFMPEIGQKLPLALIDKETTEFFRRLVRDVMAERKRSGTTRRDFMHLLMELKDKGRLAEHDPEDAEVTKEAEVSLELTEDDIVAQATVFFIAGFETSSTATSFALLELARHPEIQTKARAEIEEILAKYDDEVTYQALQDMRYLENILQESMRKYPPVPSHIRICTKNYKLPDSEVMLDEGTMVVYPIEAIQNDSRYFPEPKQFRPERFSGSQNSKYQYKYMPFGEGPRQCIGNRFAIIQSKLGLLAVLRRFEVRPCGRTVFPCQFDPKQFIPTTRDGIWITLVPLEEQ